MYPEREKAKSETVVSVSRMGKSKKRDPSWLPSKSSRLLAALQKLSPPGCPQKALASWLPSKNSRLLAALKKDSFCPEFSRCKPKGTLESEIVVSVSRTGKGKKRDRCECIKNGKKQKARPFLAALKKLSPPGCPPKTLASWLPSKSSRFLAALQKLSPPGCPQKGFLLP